MYLAQVATRKEKTMIKNVRWRKLPSMAKIVLAGPKEDGVITAMWNQGCSMTTQKGLFPGENLWITATDENGERILSAIGTVIWNDYSFNVEGQRCEIRFRDKRDFLGQIEEQDLNQIFGTAPLSSALSSAV